ncbi:type II toxin-antitoxin system RelE/ParE family toxin [Brucella anthropi]|uniref:type II toxin-antitoxin system RelE/ParE family toxin n=1 Tax=Brucella anthropi TaxID=529 RepID=UPI003F73D034
MSYIQGRGSRVRVFKNSRFHKFARKEKISDAMLCEAVERAERGQIDADLGAGLIKQRVARPGAGKSGGFRTLVFFRAETRAVFAFGFAKSDMANLDDAEEAYLKKAAKLVLGFADAQMDAEVAAGRMFEVNCDEQDLQE